jgi:hypothetical protein
MPNLPLGRHDGAFTRTRQDSRVRAFELGSTDERYGILREYCVSDTRFIFLSVGGKVHSPTGPGLAIPFGE